MWQALTLSGTIGEPVCLHSITDNGFFKLIDNFR